MQSSLRTPYTSSCLAERMVKPLVKSGPSSLLLLLISLTVYCLVRGLALLSPIDYSAYAKDFDDIPQELVGISWIVTGLIVGCSMFTKNMYMWRLGLLLCSTEFAAWAILLFSNHSIRIVDGLMTYCFLSVCTFTIAIRSDDPRPLRLLKEQIDDNRDRSISRRPG